MKTTKINPGVYRFEYEGYTVIIKKLKDSNHDSKWVFEYVDDLGEFYPANDWHFTKTDAMQSAKEYIVYLIENI